MVEGVMAKRLASRYRPGREYIGPRPATKKVQKLCRSLSEHTDRRTCLRDAKDIVRKLNQMLVGWANYFCLGPVSKAYRAIDTHLVERLRWWLCKKHKTPGRGAARFPDEHLYQKLGLKRLTLTTRNLPWAKA